MKEAPKEITLAKLEVVVMPNGEIISLGKSIGYVSEFGSKLSDPRSGIDGRPLGTTDGIDYTVDPIQ